MKNFFLLLVFFPVFCLAQQDTLILTTRDTLNVTLLEVGINEIKYNYPEEEPVYTIIKSRVIKIIHRSGREEIINHSANKSLELESLRAKIKLQKNLDKIKKTELDCEKKTNYGFLFGATSSYARGDLSVLRETTEGVFSYSIDHIFSPSSESSTVFGGFIEFPLSRLFSVKSKILYQQLHSKFESELINIHTEDLPEGTGMSGFTLFLKNHFNSFSVPFLLQYNIKKQNLIFFLNSGFYVGYLWGGSFSSNTLNNYSTSANYKNFDLGLCSGVGASLSLNNAINLILESNVAFGLINPVNSITVVEDVTNQQSNYLFNNSSLVSSQICIGLVYKICHSD